SINKVLDYIGLPDFRFVNMHGESYLGSVSVLGDYAGLGGLNDRLSLKDTGNSRWDDSSSYLIDGSEGFARKHGLRAVVDANNPEIQAISGDSSVFVRDLGDGKKEVTVELPDDKNQVLTPDQKLALNLSKVGGNAVLVGSMVPESSIAQSLNGQAAV